MARTSDEIGIVGVRVVDGKACHIHTSSGKLKDDFNQNLKTALQECRPPHPGHH